MAAGATSSGDAGGARAQSEQVAVWGASEGATARGTSRLARMLFQRGGAHDLGRIATLHFRPEGLVAELRLPEARTLARLS